MKQLEWNEQTRCYEGINSAGQQVTVSGDAFAETSEEMAISYVKEKHLSKDDAEQRTFEELINPDIWTSDTRGVSVDNETDW